MITIVPIQQAYKTKIERQEKLKGLRYKCFGSCAYIGSDISPCYYGCFYSDAYHCDFILGRDVELPDICNMDCIYCYEPNQIYKNFDIPYGWQIKEEWKNSIKKRLLAEKLSISSEFKMQYYEFTGIC